MAPVLGYSRPDRSDRSGRYERGGSPSSNDSNTSGGSSKRIDFGLNGFGKRSLNQNNGEQLQQTGSGSLGDSLFGPSRARSASQGSARSARAAPEQVPPPQVPAPPTGGAAQASGDGNRTSDPPQSSARRGSQSQSQSQPQSQPQSQSRSARRPSEPEPRPRIEDYCFGKPRKVNSSHSGAVELSICLQEKAVFLPTVHNRHGDHHHRHRRRRRHSADYTAPPPPPAGPEPPNDGDLYEYMSGGSNDQSSGRPGEPSSNNGYGSGAGSGAGSRSYFGLSDGLGDGSGSGSGENDNDNDNDNDEEDTVSVAEVNGPNAPEAERDVSTAALHIMPEDLGLDIQTGGISENSSQSPCATLRGSVLMKLSKPTRIKEVGLTFYCVSRTLWNLLPQPALLMDSALPNSAQVEDMAYLGVHHWDFVPLEQFGRSQASYDKNNSEQSATLIGQDLYGADAAIFRDKPGHVVHRKYQRVHNNQSCRLRGSATHQIPVFTPLSSQPRKLKQSTVQADGVLFPAGDYVYHFTLLVDARTPGSVNVPNGQVKFILAPKIVRTGAFIPNLSGKTEVDVVRAPYDLVDGPSMGPGNDSVLLSRVWDERFVYSVNVERRNITLDVPVNMTLTLLPLPGRLVKVHQVQVYIMESVSYVYSLDAAIRYVDPSLKLLLYQEDAPAENNKRAAGTLLHPTDPTEIKCKLLLMSQDNRNPKHAGPHPYARGKYGELRFLQPDVRGPYIRVKHRLLVVLRVSREADDGHGRSHFEVKIDTPVSVLSRHCVHANISLPSYTAGGMYEDEHGELPPSFDDAMEHELLGPSGAPVANPRGTKAAVTEPVSER